MFAQAADQHVAHDPRFAGGHDSIEGRSRVLQGRAWPIIEGNVRIPGALVDLQNVVSIECDIGLAEGLAGLGG